MSLLPNSKESRSTNYEGDLRCRKVHEHTNADKDCMQSVNFHKILSGLSHYRKGY